MDPLDYLRGENIENLGAEKEYSGVLIFGKNTKLQQEGKRLADLLGINVECIDERLEEYIETKKPEIILFEESDTALDIASRLAQRLKLGLVTGCVKLEIDYSQRLLLIHRPLYDGKAIEVATCKTKPQMAMMR